VINVLTSGDYGPVTINRSVSIVSDGAEAGIFSHAAGAAIKINGSNVDVLLRGLTIDLFGASGAMGIHFVKGAALHVHNCTIRGSSAGIRFTPNLGLSELYVSDSLITNSVAEGIVVSPASSTTAKAVISRSRVQNSGGYGIFFDGVSGGINATVSDSVSAGNTGSGIFVAGFAFSPVNVMIDRTSSVNNFSVGLEVSSATARIGDSTISGNNTGLVTANGGAIASYGTNKVSGNFPGGDGAPTTTVAHK
jgi:hypothetical protein